jgi:hypothetical protein
MGTTSSSDATAPDHQSTPSDADSLSLDPTPLGLSPPEWLWATMRIEMDFPLQSKSNYRRRAKSSSWADNRAFEQAAAALARAARPAKWVLGSTEEPLKSRPTVVMVLLATSLLDTANLSKSVADAFEGVLYHNDASVRMVLSTSTRSRMNQCSQVLLALLTPEASLWQMRVALDVLLDDYTPELASPDA